MRFREFFIEYKIGLKKIDNPASFGKQPLYIRVTLFIFYMFIIAGMILTVIKGIAIGSCVCFIGLAVFALYTFLCISKNKKDLDKYKKYSDERIYMLYCLLNKYGVEHGNVSKIDLLINEAKDAQSKVDLIAYIRSALKKWYIVLSPIAVVLYKTLFKDDSVMNFWIICSIGMVLLTCVSIYIFIKELIYIIYEYVHTEYKYYDNLTYDLRQIKIFGFNPDFVKMGDMALNIEENKKGTCHRNIV